MGGLPKQQILKLGRNGELIETGLLVATDDISFKFDGERFLMRDAEGTIFPIEVAIPEPGQSEPQAESSSVLSGPSAVSIPKDGRWYRVRKGPRRNTSEVESIDPCDD